MLEIGAFEAKNTLGSLLDRVESGEEVLITRHGKPVARLLPTISNAKQEEAWAAAQRIRERGAALRLGPFNWEEIKRDSDEGRP